jgi:hypothetical protein
MFESYFNHIPSKRESAIRKEELMRRVAGTSMRWHGYIPHHSGVHLLGWIKAINSDIE